MKTAGEGGEKWGAAEVKALRAHMALTQDRMARELGIRQQTVSEWERGVYRPRGASKTALKMIAERAGFRYDASPDGGQETAG